MGEQGSIIGKEEVTYQLLKSLCVRLQSPKIEQTAVKAVADVDSLVIIKLFCGLPEHHAEDAEQSWCQETTLFHAVGDGKGFREVAVRCDLSALVFVQLKNLGATETLQDQPEYLPAQCRTLWSGRQTLRTALCFAPDTSLEAA